MWVPIEGRVVRPSRSPAASSRDSGRCTPAGGLLWYGGGDARYDSPDHQSRRTTPTQAAAGLAATALPHRHHDDAALAHCALLQLDEQLGPPPPPPPHGTEIPIFSAGRTGGGGES